MYSLFRVCIVRAVNKEMYVCFAAPPSPKKPRSPVHEITEHEISSLENKLEDADRILINRCKTHIPRDLETLEHLVIEHKVCA